MQRGTKLSVGILAGVVLVIAFATISNSAVRSSDTLDLSARFDQYEEQALAQKSPGASLSPVEQGRVLTDAYRSLVPTDDADALRDLNAQYERIFATLGFVASPDPEKPSSSPPPEQEETGINSDGEDLPGFQVNNRWTGKVSEGYLTVFAGASVARPEEGAVQLLLNGEPVGDPISAAGQGPLLIEKVQGNVLVLVDGAGMESRFDVVNRRFT